MDNLRCVIATAKLRRDRLRVANQPIDQPQRQPRRSAFTLVELMVVIAVISILISLLLPAVQSARESARRLECRNNLRQLALGIRNYENAKKNLPPAGLVGTQQPTLLSLSTDPFYMRGGKMISWVVLILPYIEELPLYQQFDLQRNVLDQSKEPQATPLKTMFCPSDDAQGRFFFDTGLTAGKRLAKGNYAAFVSPYHTNYTDWWPGGLSGSRRYPLKDIVDGASKTLLLSEVRTRDNEHDQRGVWALPWTGSTLLAFDMHDDAPRSVDYSDFYTPRRFSYHASSDSLGLTQLPNNLGPNVDMLYNCPDSAGAQLDGMPCAKFDIAPDPVTKLAQYGYLSAAPRSRHMGGVNVVFLDSHIGFIPDNIDETTMAYLISSNDGQTIDSSQYER